VARHSFLLFTALVLGLAVNCRSPEARFVERFAPDFEHARHTVSVFGVYKDGQLSSEAWDALRPRIEPLLGGRGCEIGSGAPLASVDSPLSTAIDDYARANGPTDDLLAQLAPAAEGDLILVLTEAGRLPAPEKKVSVADSPSPRGPGSQGGSGKGGLSVFASDRQSGDTDHDLLQLSASLFSVARGRSVALVDMQYRGTSVEEAASQFSARLARSLPDSICRGWSWTTKVSAERIRSLMGG
jgi:hypothetical protein